MSQRCGYVRDCNALSTRCSLTRPPKRRLRSGARARGDVTSLICFLAAAALTIVATPWAIRLARRTNFYDQPKGYKQHAAPTPYLGGLAVIGSALLIAT